MSFVWFLEGRQALVTWIGAAGIVLRRKPSCLSWFGSAWLVGLVRSWWIEWFLEEEPIGEFWKLVELESLDRFSFVEGYKIIRYHGAWEVSSWIRHKVGIRDFV